MKIYLKHIILILLVLPGCVAGIGGPSSGGQTTVRAVPLPVTYLDLTLGVSRLEDVVSVLGSPDESEYRKMKGGEDSEVYAYVPNEVVIRVVVREKNKETVEQIYSPGRRNILYILFIEDIVFAVR